MRHDPRFERTLRLLGAAGLARLQAAHVAVMGLGGVGSWTVEALARSGVGALTLVDPDMVALTNFNRQLPALEPHLGRPKAVVLAERVQAINPACRVTPVVEAFGPETTDRLLEAGLAAVVDALDSPSRKALLMATGRARGMRLVTVGGAAGRADPTQVRVADLARTSHDPLLAAVRRCLRAHHGFPRGTGSFGVECVFSTEPVSPPPAPSAEHCEDTQSATARQPGSRDHGRGTLCPVTGVFGLVAASRILAQLAGEGDRALGDDRAAARR